MTFGGNLPKTLISTVLIRCSYTLIRICLECFLLDKLLKLVIMHTYVFHSRTPSLFTGTISIRHHYPSYHPTQLNEENNKKWDLCTFELQTTATKTHNTHSILADQSSGMFTTDRPCSLSHCHRNYIQDTGWAKEKKHNQIIQTVSDRQLQTLSLQRRPLQ